MTSIWGVVFSLIFNFTEKFLERCIRKNIDKLQNEIDDLFPRIVAEQVLSNIETHSAQSRNALAELGEKIGDRMQEVMNGVSETISSEITRTLSEAMKALADKVSTSSESALETLIQEFSTKIGSAGDEQRLAMQEVTANLARLPEMLQEMLAKTQTQLAGGISKQQEQDENRQKALQGLVNETQQNQNTLIETLQAVNSEQKKANMQLMTELDRVIASFNHLIERH